MKRNQDWRIEPAGTTTQSLLNCGIHRSTTPCSIRPRKPAPFARRIANVLLIGGLLFSLAMADLAFAGTTVYEAFDYSSVGSDLNGNNGGTGFSGPWVPGGYNASLFDNYDIAAGSLTFGSLVVSGNRVYSPAVNAIAGLTRPLSQSLGAAGTTRYVSFLVRPEGTVGAGIFNGFFGLILHRPDTFPGANPEPPELFIGKPGGEQIDQYVMESRGGAMQIPSGVLAQSGQTVLVVVRADFTADTDQFTLYINPTPGCPEPSTGIVKQDIDNGTITELTLYSSGEFSMDELRVGNTFADVTPAASVAYEGFDYSPAGSDLNGNNGGIGFSGPWVPGGYNASLFDNYDIAAGSLTFGSLLVSGNRVHSSAVNAIAGLTRPLSGCLGTPGTTRYISFLLRPEGTLDAGIFNGFFGMILHRPDTFPGANPEPPELFVGKPGNTAHEYVLENRGGSSPVASGVPVEIGETAFIVIKAEFAEGNDTFTLYMNPSPGCPEPSPGIIKQDIDNGMITELTIYSSGEFSMDELRVGNTFADVTPSAPTAPLTLNCPDDLVLECGQDNTAAIAAWLASATCSGGCGNCQVTHDYTGLSEGDCGTATVTFTATDCCGIATCTRTISVIWNFTGFFPPVENPPVFNRAKAGSGIPVRFSLGGDQGLDIFAAGYPASGTIPCDIASPSVPLQETVAAGSSHLNYNPTTGQYTFIWKTDKAWAGTCRELIVKLADGTSHSAYFNFTR